jgi:predicted dehydrogenase
MIGCGFFAQFQIEAWRRMPCVELAAAADPDLPRAAKAAPHAYASAEEMLDNEQLDFIDIATRPESHLALVRLAASRGLPVICQKPVAPNWTEAVALVEAAETAGVRLMIHENWRWQAWYREAQRLIASGAIGRPLTYWFRTRRADGLLPSPYPAQPYFSRMPRLLIYETVVHHIDTARFLFGDVASIYALTRRANPHIAGEDQTLLTLEHTTGINGIIDGNRYTEPPDEGPALGEAGFEGDAGALTLRNTGDLYLGAKRVWQNNVTEGYRGDSVRATHQHFIDCLRTGTPFESEGRDYLLKTFRVVEAAYESAKARAAVAI